jgi:hypothetical protein
MARCADCCHFEADQEDGNDGMGAWYETCNALPYVRGLKQFPFEKTKCIKFTPKEGS